AGAPWWRCTSAEQLRRGDGGGARGRAGAPLRGPRRPCSRDPVVRCADRPGPPRRGPGVRPAHHGRLRGGRRTAGGERAPGGCAPASGPALRVRGHAGDRRRRSRHEGAGALLRQGHRGHRARAVRRTVHRPAPRPAAPPGLRGRGGPARDDAGLRGRGGALRRNRRRRAAPGPAAPPRPRRESRPRRSGEEGSGSRGTRRRPRPPGDPRRPPHPTPPPRDPGAAATDADRAAPGPRPGDRYTGLAALLARAGSPEGPVPRASLTLDAADDWTVVAADAIGDLDPDLGALVIAPDQRDVARLSRVLAERGIAHEVLAGTEGPEKRYRTFRRILRGATRVVLGNRSAAFAPVRNLALAICWDEADDLLEELRAPYPHTRTVLQCRSAEERCALLFLAASDSVTLRALADHGYLAR